jgi:multidrug efflux system outer membrane protein
VGPNYHRPALSVPVTYRGDTEQTQVGIGDEKWWQIFHDETLQKLIRTALKQNYNVQIAAARVLQYQEQIIVTRSNEFPTVTAGPLVTGEREATLGNYPAIKYVAKGITGTATWTPDFWGQYRRATEAARANLLSQEWAKRAVISTLVADIATAYFQMRELDLELEIAKQALASRQNSLQLTTVLETGGASSLVDVKQAQQLVETAAATIPETEREIAVQENLISIDLGENPTDIPRGLKLVDEPIPATVPAGLPSQLLERRPDIQEAEANLVSANAEIGVARAQLFPSLPLTGGGGLVNAGLSNLFVGSAQYWTFTAPLTQPIFNAGRLRANVRVAEAEQQQALLTYKQNIVQAFGDVSNALIGYRKYREFREHQAALTGAAKDATNLAQIRYKGGVTSYLEVLTNDTNYFSAELNLARAQLNERLGLVQVYESLGGGWQE